MTSVRQRGRGDLLPGSVLVLGVDVHDLLVRQTIGEVLDDLAGGDSQVAISCTESVGDPDPAVLDELDVRGAGLDLLDAEAQVVAEVLNERDGGQGAGALLDGHRATIAADDTAVRIQRTQQVVAIASIGAEVAQQARTGLASPNLEVLGDDGLGLDHECTDLRGVRVELVELHGGVQQGLELHDALGLLVVDGLGRPLRLAHEEGTDEVDEGAHDADSPGSSRRDGKRILRLMRYILAQNV